MKIKILSGLAIFAMVALFSSCAKLPQAELDAANRAVDSARTAKAEIYTPELFSALQDSLNSAVQEIETQKSKFLFKNYDAAKAKLDYVNTNAGNVVAKAIAREQEVKAEVDTLLAEVKTLVEENKKLADKAPRGKEGAAAIDAIKAEIAVIETSISETTMMYEKADYMNALNKIKASKEKATSIKAELEEVASKYSKKGKKK